MVREDRQHVEPGRHKFGLFGIVLGAATRTRFLGLMSMFSIAQSTSRTPHQPRPGEIQNDVMCSSEKWVFARAMLLSAGWKFEKPWRSKPCFMVNCHFSQDAVLSSLSTFTCNVVVSLYCFGASASGPLQSKPLKMLLAPRVGP